MSRAQGVGDESCLRRVVAATLREQRPPNQPHGWTVVLACRHHTIVDSIWLPTMVWCEECEQRRGCGLST